MAGQEPDLRGESTLGLLVGLVEVAAYKDRGSFIKRVLEFAPAIRPPPSSAVRLTLEYGDGHLISLLTPVWPVPDDLPHAAGIGDFARVKVVSRNRPAGIGKPEPASPHQRPVRSAKPALDPSYTRHVPTARWPGLA